MKPFDHSKISDFRKKLNLSQRAFAQRLGVRQTTVYRWERGRSSPNANLVQMMYEIGAEQNVDPSFYRFDAHQTDGEKKATEVRPPQSHEADEVYSSAETEIGQTVPQLVGRVIDRETGGTEDPHDTDPWTSCLAYIAHRINEQSFNTWFKPTRGETIRDGLFRITVPNQFVADWMKERFSDVIDESFREVLGQTLGVEYVIAEPEQAGQTVLDLAALDHESTAPAPASTLPLSPSRPIHNLNRRYDFDSLVVGDFNQFACAAAMAVAEAPGLTKYNPLFIYGGTGLGKTHIVQAIGNSILDAFPSKRVLYATSEKFTSDFISSISDRTISDFTRMYRDVDVLIIDDIQFFSGKESTQEQFFHTFNSLHHQGKMIVLTADRPPKEIKGLEERLLSRFQWGLVADLQAPDLENRTAILYKKLETEGTSIAESVIKHIAESVTISIRELEGALIRVLAYASLSGSDVDMEIAEKVLGDVLTSKRREIDLETIQAKTAEAFDIEPRTMKGKKKSAEVALARQVAMYLSRSLTDNSLKMIGAAFGGRDHSTVIHACDLISRKMSKEPWFREKIDHISASLLY